MHRIVVLRARSKELDSTGNVPPEWLCYRVRDNMCRHPSHDPGLLSYECSQESWLSTTRVVDRNFRPRSLRSFPRSWRVSIRKSYGFGSAHTRRTPSQSARATPFRLFSAAWSRLVFSQQKSLVAACLLACVPIYCGKSKVPNKTRTQSTLRLRRVTCFVPLRLRATTKSDSYDTRRHRHNDCDEKTPFCLLDRCLENLEALAP
jgi:hypothetical protein